MTMCDLISEGFTYIFCFNIKCSFFFAVSPINYATFPSLFNSIPVINPGVPGCEIFLSELFNCSYNIVLGDGIITPPSPSDLQNDDFVKNFIAWRRDSMILYIDFHLLTASSLISKIELRFLNSPAHRIGLPDLKLTQVIRSTGTTTVFLISKPTSVLTDNEDVSQNDNFEMRSVSLHTNIQPMAGLIIRIAFLFNETYDNLEWFFLSEVIFCTDILPPLNNVSIVFASPTSDVVIRPSPEMLQNASNELMCTVSSQGLYRWQWKKDGSLIEIGDSKYRVSVGEGSRTTWLRISDFGFSDAGRYECTASTMDISLDVFSDTRIQDVEFPGESCSGLLCYTLSICSSRGTSLFQTPYQVSRLTVVPSVLDTKGSAFHTFN